MATTNAKVSSASLSELQNSLMKLATELDQLRDLMNADMTDVNAYWDDPKYQEFKECYSKQIQKCGEISEKYFAWSDKVLSPTIERVVKIEMTDVGASISGGGVSAASAGGAAVGGAGASAAASGVSVGKAGGFNISGRTQPSEGSKTANKIDAFLKNQKENRPLSKADKACIEVYGPGYRGEPASPQNAHIIIEENRSNATGNNSVSAGIDVDAGVIKGHLGSEANSGTEATGFSKKKGINCKPFNI